MDLLIHAEVAGTRDYLDGVRRRLESPALLSQLGGLMADYQAEVFHTRNRGKWAPDDPVTVSLKGSSRVLVDSGELFDSLTTARIEGETVTLHEGDAFYARFHRAGERGMPRRDPAPEPSASQQTDWVDSLLTYVVEGTPAR